MQGQLLLAHPLLNDGFFNRSVVYLTNHSEEGAVGFCMNFKTQFLLRDVRPQVNKGNFPIYEGGPVGRNQLFFLHTLGHQLTDAIHVKDNIFVGGDFNELLHKIEHGKVNQQQVRFFAGYSGWSENQLENEIERKHWLVDAYYDERLFNYEAHDMWGQKLGDVQDGYEIFADFGYDPSMN